MPVDFSKVENRSFTKAEESFFEQATHDMMQITGPEFRLTPMERKTIAKISHSNKGFVDDAMEAIRNYPDMMPGYIKLPSLEQSWTYFKQLQRAELQIARLTELIRDRKLAVGSLLFRDSLTVYRVLQAGDPHAIAGLEALIKRMKHRFAAHGPIRIGNPGSDSGNGDTPVLDSSDDGTAGDVPMAA